MRHPELPPDEPVIGGIRPGPETGHTYNEEGRTLHAACGGEIVFDPNVQSGPGSLAEALSKHRCAKPSKLPASIDEVVLTFQLGGSAWKLTGTIQGDEAVIRLWHDQTKVDEVRAGIR